MDSEESRTALSTKILASDFQPVQYLNETLPVLNLSIPASTAKNARVSQLQSSSADIQSQFTKLNAYNAVSSTELNTLTDEILRSSNRLAYEIEVLRSDANGLFDLLSDTLQEDIQLFVGSKSLENIDHTEAKNDTNGALRSVNDPDFMQQLRTLGQIKARLESVIRIFGEALKWPRPASDVSVATSLISVSAPELGIANSAEDDKARAVTRQHREEITELLGSEGGGYAGVDAAQNRVDEFRDLASIWKGTAEEKPRMKVVDGFAKMVTDRRRILDSQSQPGRSQLDSARFNAHPSRTSTPGPTGGLLGGLRKLRDEMYLE